MCGVAGRGGGREGGINADECLHQCEFELQALVVFLFIIMAPFNVVSPGGTAMHCQEASKNEFGFTVLVWHVLRAMHRGKIDH